MLKLIPAGNGRGPLRVLCIGAHPDDIEIGCGGTLLRLLDEHSAACMRWVVLSSPGERASEAAWSAADFSPGATVQVELCDFPESFFPYHGADIKKRFEALKSSIDPDIVFTHHRGDLHQDHRLLAELTWNTFRDHLILEYEIPKYDGDPGAPNVYVPLSREICGRKVGHLLAHYPSQARKYWFTEDTFMALLRLRGIEACRGGNYAEAFYCRKIML